MSDTLLKQWLDETSASRDESLIGVSPEALTKLLQERNELAERLNYIQRVVFRPPEPEPSPKKMPVIDPDEVPRYRASLLAQIRIAAGDPRGRLNHDDLIRRIRSQAIGDELWEFLEDPRFELYFRGNDWNACFTDDDIVRHLKGANPRALMEELVDDLDDEGVL